MSWSFHGVGTPDALLREIDRQCEQYSGQSREEFDAARPHLKGLVEQAVPASVAVVSVNAHGHASFTNGVKTQGNIAVEIKQIGPLYT
jgi:hypothetical protein